MIQTVRKARWASRGTYRSDLFVGSRCIASVEFAYAGMTQRKWFNAMPGKKHVEYLPQGRWAHLAVVPGAFGCLASFIKVGSTSTLETGLDVRGARAKARKDVERFLAANGWRLV